MGSELDRSLPFCIFIMVRMKLRLYITSSTEAPFVEGDA